MKDVEYYAANVTAWFNTSLEFDKSIFAISGGGIGLLTTPLVTGGVKTGLQLALYGAALMAFLICLLLLLSILRLNKTHLAGAVHDSSGGIDVLLKRLDLGVAVLFGTAVLCTALIGLLAGITSYSMREPDMSVKNDSKAVNDLVPRSFANSTTLSPISGSSVTSPKGTSVAAPVPATSSTAGAATTSTAAQADKSSSAGGTPRK